MTTQHNACVVAAILLAVSSAQAAIINVPGDQPTIQAAIDIAVFGDEVVVAPGIYTEAIDFVGKAITVRSSGGPVATTISAAGPSDSVVKCVSGEGPTTVLDGFTITGAFNNGGPGGLEISGSSPTVTNCIIAGNVGTSGGGMDNNDSSPTVINCIPANPTGSIRSSIWASTSSRARHRHLAPGTVRTRPTASWTSATCSSSSVIGSHPARATSTATAWATSMTSSRCSATGVSAREVNAVQLSSNCLT